MKKVLSVVLVLCMLMAFMPTALAVSTAPDFSDGWKALTSSDAGKLLNGGNYYLNEDITIDRHLFFTGNVVLDLNGHVIKLNSSLYGGTAKENVIMLCNIGGNGDFYTVDFTLQDSNPTAKHYFSKQANGLWKWEPSVTETTEGYQLVEGGVITGGTGFADGNRSVGGGVYIEERKPDGRSWPINANITGGNIVGCQADKGGGIYNNQGTLTLSGGNIIGCVASEKGGGIYSVAGTFAMNDGEINSCKAKYGGGEYNGIECDFSINGGVIEDCVATESGGAIYNYSTAMININNGIIKSCTAQVGGGVFISSYGRFEINGGRIESCTATNDSSTDACVVFSNSSVYINGGIIKDSVSFSAQCKPERSADINTATAFLGKVIYRGTISAGIYYGGLEKAGNEGKIEGDIYTVKFFENSTDTEPYATALIVGDGTKLVPPTAPKKTDYTFDGWYTENESEYTFDTVVDNDFSLYANFTHTNHADNNGDGLCDVCSEEVPSIEPTEPTEEKTLRDYIIDVVIEAIKVLIKIIKCYF